MGEITVTVTTKSDGINAHIDDATITAWIEERLNDARNRFITSMGSGGHSAPGAYPNQQTGALASSVDSEMTGAREGHLFSDIEYAGYLAEGTSKMAKRKMLWEAMTETIDERPETDQLAEAVKITGGP